MLKWEKADLKLEVSLTVPGYRAVSGDREYQIFGAPSQRPKVWSLTSFNSFREVDSRIFHTLGEAKQAAERWEIAAAR